MIFLTPQFDINSNNIANAQSCTGGLSVPDVTASGNDGNVPSNVLDNNLNTRWSNLGVGSWIEADLESVFNVCRVDIAWYLGNQRTSNFVIEVSTDGNTFTNVFSGTSSGTTINPEAYAFSSTNARYVRVTVNGNTQNNFASITELDVSGSSLSGNFAPVANNQVVFTGKNTAKNILLSASDSNNDPLIYSIVTAPQHGSVTGGTSTSRIYTPTTGYTGSDSFIFRASDGSASDTATASISVVDPTSCPTNVPVSFVIASGNDGNNVPANVLDNNLNTRWSNQGTPWIAADLGSVKTICSIDIAWYLGNQRQYGYAIVTSTDGNTWNDPFSGTSQLTVQLSSGTTANSMKNFIPPTNARYIGIVAIGITNSLVGITELDIFTSGVTNTDPFGIIKLYPTKNNGEQWYMNMNNPTSDSRFNPQNTITRNPDGSWKMKATQVRMAVYTSTGYDGDDIPTLDHSDIAAKGYMLRPNDWRNFEMTQYVKVNTSPSDDNFSPNGRGGRHTGDGPPEGCEGSSMKGDVFFSGKVRFAKEQWHVSYVFTSLKSPTSSIEDKWVGIKFIVYNFVQNNKVVVKTELWLDTNNSGNFVKVDERVDSGGWGTEGTECGGVPDQIISWGGPITTFRWDTATDVDFKNLSVREIIPPQ